MMIIFFEKDATDGRTDVSFRRRFRRVELGERERRTGRRIARRTGGPIMVSADAGEQTRLSVVHVTTEIKKHIDEINESLETIRNACEACAEAAEAAEMESKGSSAPLRVEVERMCELQREKMAQIEALKCLEREYEGRADVDFDFKDWIAKKVKHFIVTQPKKMDHLIAFDRVAKGRAAELNADEDLMVDERESGATRNTKCPLTLVPVERLNEPVEDAKGFIYERKAIVEFIGRKSSRECPMAGTKHKVTVAELRESRVALKLKQRAQAVVGDGAKSQLVSP